MHLVLLRDVFNKDWTQGQLFINDQFFCYTLEDTDRFLEAGGVKTAKKTAIPRGVYKVVVNMSPRFKTELPLLQNVPNFTGIRIHAGNTHEDTDGCILVGMGRSEDGTITKSRLALSGLMNWLEQSVTPDIIEVR